METKATNSKKKGPRWLIKLAAWLELKRLEHEFRSSRNFQRECERLRCFHLAKMEEDLRVKIAEQINALKR